MAASDHADTFAHAGLVVSLTKLAILGAPDVHWDDVVRQYETMDTKGALTPLDRRALEEARVQAAKESAK
jgi:hypothetical protein